MCSRLGRGTTSCSIALSEIDFYSPINLNPFILHPLWFPNKPFSTRPWRDLEESKRDSNWKNQKENQIESPSIRPHPIKEMCVFFFGVNTQTGKPSKMITSYEGAICVQNIYDSHNLCNSHEILHFAASLIEGRTEVSIVKRFFCSMNRFIWFI